MRNILFFLGCYFIGVIVFGAVFEFMFIVISGYTVIQSLPFAAICGA